MSTPGHESDRTRRHHVRIVEQEQISDGVYYLRVERPFDFLPGQCIAMAMSQISPARYYSLASDPADTEIGILYDLVPGGALTPHLSRLRSGESVWLSDPFGTFVDDEGPAVWIATGTGVAPFLSRARSLAGDILRSRKWLIHGGRTNDRFYFGQELARRMPDRFLRCCSQCEPSLLPAGSTGRDEFDPIKLPEAGLYRGRLTVWLTQALAARIFEEGSRFLLCGSAGMVVNVRDMLIAAGIPFDRILSEIYF